MTSDRSLAYGRAMKILADLSASKLHADEEQAIRDAADALFFCEGLASDHEARRALDSLEELTDRLIENGRLLPETGGRLIADVQACGPLLPALR